MFTKCSLSGTSQLSFCDTPLLFRPHLGHRATHTGHPCGFYGAGLSAEHILHSRGFLQPCTFEYHEELNLYPRRTQHINFARYSHLFPRITSADTTTSANTTKNPASFDTGSFSKINRRRPTLPHPQKCSTIGAKSLSFWVRNGARRFPLAIITGKWRRGDSNP